MTEHLPGILVLCTGNSCRSQIAEAYLKKYVGDRFEIYSAGTEPAVEVHPMAVEVMADDGIDISDKEPSDYRELLGKVPARYLITVCDGAAKACPAVWPGMVERMQWPFDDPAAFVGSEEERRAGFRRVRDEIRERIRAWAAGT